MANMVLKKTLLLLGVGVLAIAAAGSVVFKTNNYDDKVILVQMNKNWITEGYQAAIDSTNKQFKEMGLNFKVQGKERDIFEEYDQISKKGVKDKNISDVFMLGFDRYLGYVEQSNIKDVSAEIKQVLLQTPEDEEHYGAKVIDDQINIEGENNIVWKTAKLNRNNEDFFGMVPASIENNIWLFDQKVLGMKDENGQKKLSGTYFDYAKSKDSSITEKPSLENLIKINNIDQLPKSFLKTVDGFIGGNVLNAMVNKNREEILQNTDETDASLVWLEKGKSPYTKDVNDFDSLFENSKFDDDYKKAAQSLQDYGLSFGKDIRDKIVGQTGDNPLNTEVTAKLKDGTIKMELIAPYQLSDHMTTMKEPGDDPNFGVASVNAVTIDNSENSPNLSGFAGGYGWAIKSTIANKTLTDNQGNKVTKTQAAMMFIKELSQPKYAAGLARSDGKYSAFKKNVDVAYLDLINSSTPGNNDKYIAEAMKEISDGYIQTPPVVTSRPTTALFDIYWEVYAPSYRTAMEKETKDEFYRQFNQAWKVKKAGYRWG